MEPKEIWQARWDSLEQRLDTLIQRYNDPRLAFPHNVTAYSFVRCLKAFARTYFEWFRDGFSPQPTAHILLPFEDTNNITLCGYSDDYAFNAILAQVGQDIDTIEDAAESRLSATQAELDILAKADDLARRALQPAINKQWFVNRNPTVLTYFDKRQSIRVVPYANVALVGIPRTVLQSPRDFLAIAHEVGHYVYWHGKQGSIRIVDFVETGLKQCLNDGSPENTVVMSWAEEMFADAYGAAIGGPVMAIDFQDIANREPEKDFFKDDGDHPTPVVRPGLYSQIESLRAKQRALLEEKDEAEATTEANGVAKLFTDHWSEKRDERSDKNPDADIVPKTPPIMAPLTIPAIQSKVDLVIEEVFWKGLVSNLNPWLPGVTDKLTDNEANDLNTLYTRFQAAIAGPAGVVDDLPLPSEADLSLIWKNWVLTKEKFFDSEAALSASLIYAGNPTDSDPKNVWLPVLIARGWTVEGPNSQWKK